VIYTGILHVLMSNDEVKGLMTAAAIPIYAATLTHTGGRKTNEDAIYACKNIDAQQLVKRGYLYIVADGTGGQEGGQTASAMVAAIVSERYYDDDAPDLEAGLRLAVQTAHEALYQLSERVATWSKMSTTIVAAVVHEGYLYLAHVGDSRAYLVRDGQAHLLTRDHVWLEDDENYGSLMRWLGGGQATIEVDTSKIALKEGDKILLCSDGLTNVADREDLEEVVARLPPQVAGEQLIEIANRRGTSDNVSVAVIQYGGVMPKAPRPAWLLPVIAVSILLLVVGTAAFLALRGGENGGGSGMIAGGTITPTLVQKIEGATVATSTTTPTQLATAIAGTRQPTSTPRPVTPTPSPSPTSQHPKPPIASPSSPPTPEPTTEVPSTEPPAPPGEPTTEPPGPGRGQ